MYPNSYDSQAVTERREKKQEQERWLKGDYKDGVLKDAAKDDGKSNSSTPPKD